VSPSVRVVLLALVTSAAGALGVLGVGANVGCGGSKPEAPLDAGAVSSSIALVGAGAGVAVTNPDQGSVSFLDPDTLAVTTTTAVGGEPHALLALSSGPAAGALLVANHRGGEIVVLDQTSGAVLRRASVCPGAFGIASAPDASFVVVSCEWDGTVRRLDPVTLAASAIATGLRRPRAIAVVGTDVLAADYVGGVVHRFPADGSGTDATQSLVPASADYRPALTKMSANLTTALVPAAGAVRALHVLENNTGDTSEPVADDYGTVATTNPKVNPALTSLDAGAAPGAGAVTYAKFDGGTKVFSGPSALAPFGGHFALISHVSTANVAVVDLDATDETARVVGAFRVGFGPTGVAVDEARHVAFVDNTLDQSVSRIDLTKTFDATAPRYDADATLVRMLPSPYSAAALAGRRLFFDATNKHVTPSGVVACASCHPNGSDDGLVWFEHTPNVPLRRRRTPDLANAKTATAPFHWDGQFPTMPALVHSTMTNIMGGDGLLVDVSTVQAFIDEIVQAPVLPPSDAAAVARGKALFSSADVKCATCHAGAITTDDLLHTVLNPTSLTADDAIPATNTPGLHGVFLRAPYFHDGRATDLHDVLTRPDAAAMGHTQGLSASQLDDLIAYVQSL
jgi:DNA-binding beta-propeller fold protein YncE